MLSLLQTCRLCRANCNHVLWVYWKHWWCFLYFVETFQRFKAPFFRRFKTLSKVIEHVFFLYRVSCINLSDTHTYKHKARIWTWELCHISFLCNILVLKFCRNRLYFFNISFSKLVIKLFIENDIFSLFTF